MKIIQTIATVCALTTAMAGTSFAGQAEIDAIEHSFNTGNTQLLTELSESTVRYENFLARYRLGLHFSLTDKRDNALTTLEQLIPDMESHIDAFPEDADTLALLANVYGFTISLVPAKAVTYGPRSHKYIQGAVTLSKTNPRVQLFKGIIDYNTPPAFGGDRERAQKSFQEAINRFPGDIESGKHWGHSEALTWLGLTYLQLGDSQSAQEYWQQALTITPDYGWAKKLLNDHKPE